MYGWFAPTMLYTEYVYWKSLAAGAQISGVVTPLSSHSQSAENGDMARSPCKAEGEEWRMEKTYCAKV